jgi:hypothetical protein
MACPQPGHQLEQHKHDGVQTIKMDDLRLLLAKVARASGVAGVLLLHRVIMKAYNLLETSRNNVAVFLQAEH